MKNGLSNLGLKMNIMSNIKTLLSIFVLLILSVSCEGGKMSAKEVLSVNNIPETKLQILSGKKIYFGHQSVGYNIMDGLKDIMKENPGIKLNMVDTNDPEMFKMPVFAHSAVGQNTKPDSKVDDFAKLMEQGIGNKADMAFLKFCYVDVDERTDVQKVFDYYKSRLTQLKGKYPDTTFIHFTMPLVSKQAGIKIWLKDIIKEILGRPVCNYSINIKRNQFNDMLKKEYEGKEPVFDLARIESTLSEGRRLTLTKDGVTFYSMLPEYTDDGGHLNEKGRKIVANELLLFLANLPE